MAIEIPWGTRSLEAGADLSAKQFFGCKISSGKAVVCGAGEAISAGVNLGTPESGEAASFGMLGVFPVICGAAITALDEITPDANGEFVKAYGMDAVAGIALEDGADGEVIDALIIPQLRKPMPSYIAIPIALSSLANGDVITTFTPGFAGRIKSVKFAVNVAASTPSKAADINLEINTTNLTGGVVGLTTALCAKGAVIAGTAITAGNTFDADDTISVEAANVTAFVEGSGVLLIELG